MSHYIIKADLDIADKSLNSFVPYAIFQGTKVCNSI